MANKKLDIFDLLKRLNSSVKNNPHSVCDSYTEDEIKNFSAFLTQKWMASCDDELQLMMLNEIVNPYLFSFKGNDKLLLSLLQISASEKNIFYKWKSQEKKNPLEELKKKIICEYYEISSLEYSKLKLLPSLNDILEMALELGFQKEDLKTLEKEIKK